LLVFVDFEASSLGKHGFPIEVGWAAEDGSEEGHLIRPAPGWQEWSSEAERVHGISLDGLRRDGEPHDRVAARMVERLSGHDLLASAASWDGQWLSKLLRAAMLPRHRLRLRDTEEAQREVAFSALAEGGVSEAEVPGLAQQVLDAARAAFAHGALAHRAIDDARRELLLWREVRARAHAVVRSSGRAPV
jgi:hypothetical protein